MTSTSSSPRADFTLVLVDPSPVTPVTVSWQDLTIVSAPVAKVTVEESTPPLLHNVSGIAKPGELHAIVGPADAGALVLLECLARRRVPTSGDIALTRTEQTAMRFVQQETPAFSVLTVHEHLVYEAELRMGSHTTREDRIGRVADVATQMGLLDCLHEPIKALAQDKCKLLAIATELLSNPSVLLLEEPVTGMDMFMAETVVRHLQRLAHAGHTVIMTLACSTLSVVFSYVDQLHILTNGRQVYKGPAAASLGFFKANGLSCPDFMNPFEFFALQLTESQGSKMDFNARVEQLVSASNALNGPALPDDLDSVTDSDITQQRPAWTTQINVLLRRNVTKVLQDTDEMRTRLAAMIFLMLLVGLVYIRLDLVQKDIQPFASACFFMAVTQFLYNALLEMLTVPKETAIALDEHRKGLYHVLHWYAVKNISELPLQVIYPLIFLTPTFFMVGFTVNTETFFTFALFLVLVVSTATGVAYFFSCAAPNRRTALKLSLIFLSPALVFGGAFVTRKTTPDYFVWLQQLSPIKYCYHGLMRAFWKDVKHIYCAPNSYCRATSGMMVLALNIVKPDKAASDAWILVAINLTFRVLGGVALVLRARKSSRAQ